MTNNEQNEDIESDCSISATINLYYDLYVPENANEPRPLLITCHGYGENKRHGMRVARECSPDDFAVASLQGFHQHIREPFEQGAPLKFGFGWLTNFKSEESVALHHKFVIDVVEKLASENIADRNKIFLMGFSQTCALNFRFAFTYTGVLRGVVGICGGMPGDWDTSELYKETNASVLYLHGVNDEFYTPERVKNFESRLKQRAGEVQTKAYDAGHEVSQAMREDVYDWLTKKIKQ
jgi:phospholipase/carboxylesterase